MFECCVAKNFWLVCSELFEKSIGTDFELVAKWWLCDNKYKSVEHLHNCYYVVLVETKK
jgi:hypothetical protein